ncbi:hypothetical protein RRG08_023466 [Elysia crispata]|uniref:Uncharacterized protein n=1 Tax=Elysia crispata TaxID=231223 RepID=A0AAE1DXL3_9GAST|nr:hypothetical protein RRG08_023466 [Elysia crispata]
MARCENEAKIPAEKAPLQDVTSGFRRSAIRETTVKYYGHPGATKNSFLALGVKGDNSLGKRACFPQTSKSKTNCYLRPEGILLKTEGNRKTCGHSSNNVVSDLGVGEALAWKLIGQIRSSAPH